MNKDGGVLADGLSSIETMTNPSASRSPDSFSSSGSDGMDHDAYIIACDWIKYRLEKENYTWRDCPQLPDPPSRACLIMRALCENFESRSAEMQSLVNALPISPATAYNKYLKVCQALFDEHSDDPEETSEVGPIRWGRIVALFTFAGLVAVRCVREQMPQIIGPVADWTGAFSEMHLDEWIQSHGGWEGMISFYERRNQEEMAESWLSFRRVMAGFGVVCGVVGALTFGSLAKRA